MIAGLQVFDASSRLILDGTRRILRYIGAANLSGGTGSVSDPSISPGTAWYAFQRSQTFKLSGGNNPHGTLGYMIPPVITVSGNSLIWTYPGKRLADDEYAVGILFYGVY